MEQTTIIQDDDSASVITAPIMIDDDNNTIDESTLNPISTHYRDIQDWYEKSFQIDPITSESIATTTTPKMSPLFIFGQRGCGKTTTITKFFRQKHFRIKYWNKCHFKQGKKILEEIRAIYSIKQHSVFYKTVYIFDDLDFFDINLTEIPYLFGTKIASPVIFIWNIAAKALKMIPLVTVTDNPEIDNTTGNIIPE
jgi:hypothetical protein